MPTPHAAHRTPGRLAAALTLALGLLSAHAQPTPSTAAPGRTDTTPNASATASAAGAGASATQRLARSDRSFVEDAAASGVAEVALGQLAQQRAASAEVKQYGEHMVTDHSKANDELMALARARGMTLADKPTSSQQRRHDKLAKLEGHDFDRYYMAEMVSDHRKAVSLFQKQARSGEDAALKAFAQKTLPTLENHLKQATTLHDTVKQQPKR